MTRQFMAGRLICCAGQNGWMGVCVFFTWLTTWLESFVAGSTLPAHVRLWIAWCAMYRRSILRGVNEISKFPGVGDTVSWDMPRLQDQSYKNKVLFGESWHFERDLFLFRSIGWIFNRYYSLKYTKRRIVKSTLFSLNAKCIFYFPRGSLSRGGGGYTYI